MFDIGLQELIVIFIVVLLVFGPKRVPELGRALGKGLAELKRSLQDVKEQVETEFKETTSNIKEAVEGGEKGPLGKELAEFKRSLQDVKEQVETEFRVMNADKKVEEKEEEREEA
ncbi:MAG: twin-arginine translocase TatA/TatE family subunit [Nitrospirota bacterium]